MFSFNSSLDASLRRTIYAALLLVVGVMLSSTIALAGDSGQMHQMKDGEKKMVSRAEVLEHMQYGKAHDLTDAQEALRVAGLDGLTAPCCKDFSAATCCCPCNLAKALWGMTKKMIIEDEATAEEINVAAAGWLENISAKEFTGDACFTGGCGRNMRNNGCGGMAESDVKI
jgi:hypothetical protein